MLDIFKSWINIVLAIGILFTIVRIIMPNTKLKKYIYSLMGIVTVIAIVGPIVKVIKTSNMQNGLKNILLNMSSVETLNMNYTDLSNYEDVNKNNVKENFKQKVEDDIKQKLLSNANIECEVSIDITDTYNIEKITIKLKDDTDYDIASYINQEYDIDKNKIKIEKGG